MEKVSLENAVRAFRMVVEAHKHRLGPVFREFPRGSCGATSELLAAFLKDCQLGTFSYVSGWHREKSISHAWLELEELIVDVTSDQFPERGGASLVTTDRSWHAQFSRDVERRVDGDFRLLSGAGECGSQYDMIYEPLMLQICVGAGL